jgi:hypothetical protein
VEAGHKIYVGPTVVTESVCGVAPQQFKHAEVMRGQAYDSLVSELMRAGARPGDAHVIADAFYGITPDGENIAVWKTGDIGALKAVLEVGGFRLSNRKIKHIKMRFKGNGYIFSGDGRNLEVRTVSWRYLLNKNPELWSSFPEEVLRARKAGRDFP